MIDFNTKKRVLKRLSDYSKKRPLMLPLCFIAAAFIKLYYFIACHIDIMLSDKNGNFLGIVHNKKPAGRKNRRQDDIIYRKKPFIARLLSSVLVIAFFTGFMPDFGNLRELGLLPDFGIRAGAAFNSMGPFNSINDLLTAIRDHNEANPADALEPDPTSGNRSWVDRGELTAAQALHMSFSDVKEGQGAVRLAWNAFDAAELAGTGVMPGDVRYHVNGSGPSTFGTPQQGISTTNRPYNLSPYTGLTPGEYTVKISVDIPIKKYDIITEFTNTGDPIYTLSNLPAPEAFHVVDDGSVNPVTVDLNRSLPLAEMTSATYYPAGTIEDNPPGVEVKWEALSEDPYPDVDYTLVKYAVFRATLDPISLQLGDYDVIAQSDANSNVYFDEKISSGEIYSYYVVAYYNAWGDSNYYINTQTNYNAGIIDTKRVEAQAVTNARTVSVTPNRINQLTVNTDDTLNRLRLNWTKGTGNVSGFRIYKSDGEQLIPGTTDHFTFFESEVEAGNCEFVDMLSNGSANTQNYTYPLVSATTESIEINGKKYWYYVIPYVLSAGGNEIYGQSRAASNTLNIAVGSPTTFTVSSKEETINGQLTGRVDLSWTAPSSSANAYYIKVTKTDTFDHENGVYTGEGDVYWIGPLTGTSYNITGLNSKDKYSFEIYAAKNVKSETESDRTLYAEINGIPFSNVGLSAQIFSRPTPSSPRVITIGDDFTPPENVMMPKSEDGQITITWNAVRGASGYEVYAVRGTVDTLPAGTRVLHSGTATTYTHRNLTNTDTWTYFVRAYKIVNGTKIYTDLSYPCKAIVGIQLRKPIDVTVTPNKDGTGVIITWSKVEGAEGYLLHTALGGREILPAHEVTKESYEMTGLEKGDIWTFWVEAFKVFTDRPIYSESSERVSYTVGNSVDPPRDFNVITNDGSATISWTASANASGYIIYASNGRTVLQFDVSKSPYVHSGLRNGETWTYYAVAYRTINGIRSFSDPTQSRTVQIGVSMSNPADLIATAGNRQIDLSWSDVEGAEGYVVYLYSSSALSFEPLTITTGTVYSHIGLTNGKEYTYMVAAYKTINGVKFYGDYSLPVTAVPTTGSAFDLDRELNIKGTAPYGISHSELISAAANHDAFNESVDIYISVNDDSTETVTEVLKGYANGLSSFIVFPFDISCYLSGTRIHTSPNSGYSVTITIPVPDKLIEYRDFISVIHINESNDVDIYGDAPRMEILPSTVIETDNIWCIQFQCSDFSPFAFVIYKDQVADISSGVFAGLTDSFAGNFNSGLLAAAVLPDIMLNSNKLRVVRKKKIYRIKK